MSAGAPTTIARAAEPPPTRHEPATPVAGPKRPATPRRPAAVRPAATHPSAATGPVATRPDLARRRVLAAELGHQLGTMVDDADALAEGLRAALVELSDEAYRQELQRVAPGIDYAVGVRSPLIRALVGGLRPALRRARPAEALWIAERLSREEAMELRQVALDFLRRSLAADPERTWQLMRRLGRRAGDWISVDSLAFLVAEGILREPFRWAEIEQLVYAASPWERRLAAATVAVLGSTGRNLASHGAIPARPGTAQVTRGLAVLGSLIGDTDANVRKALSWALRELARIDLAQVTRFLSAQAERAAAERDGNRAWVIRDALGKLEPSEAQDIRERLAGIRRTPGGPATSNAAVVARRFGRLPDPRSLPEPPL